MSKELTMCNRYIHDSSDVNAARSLTAQVTVVNKIAAACKQFYRTYNFRYSVSIQYTVELVLQMNTIRSEEHGKYLEMPQNGHDRQNHEHSPFGPDAPRPFNTLRTGLLNCLNARSRGLIQS